MSTDWLDEYTEADDLSRKYRLLREEMGRLRDRAESGDFFDREEVASDLHRLNETRRGDLLVFVANDFGLPVAYRPSGVERDVQDDVRQAILQNKYDDANEDLNQIRRELLTEHPHVHKVIVSEYLDGSVRYHLPEGSNETTNFLTVREMVGLIDYTTNSSQRDGLSRTY